MSINGIGAGYTAWRGTADFVTARKQIDAKKGVLSDEKSGLADDEESKTKTDIIVKPDGSRVLVVTMSMGGMETTMSLEISKPTEVPNESSERDTDNKMLSGDGGRDAVSDEMTNIWCRK